ncbi:MAG: hypothetical protein SF123_15815 [Chloroflexota bacterium]|nr:hypothetical protein [Chloroflexota bacterium]
MFTYLLHIRAVHKILWLFLCITLVLMTQSGTMLSTAAAQPPSSLVPIHVTPWLILNAHWSTDGTTFIFQDGAPNFPEVPNTWYTLGVGQTTPVVIPEVQIVTQVNDVSPTDAHTLNLATADTVTSIVRSSPNGRYLVYAGARPANYEGYGYPRILRDTVMDQTITIPEIDVQILTDSNFGYRVSWSGDSAAFTVFAHSSFGASNMYYISGFAQALEGIASTLISTIPIDDRPTSISPEFADFSANGQQILIRVYMPQQIGLALWNPNNPMLNRLLVVHPNGEVAGDAAFSPDEQSVVFIDGLGLRRVDLTTLQTRVLDISIDARWVDDAWFSPDGSHVVLLEDDESAQRRLYMLTVPQ